MQNRFFAPSRFADVTLGAYGDTDADGTNYGASSVTYAADGSVTSYDDLAGIDSYEPTSTVTPISSGSTPSSSSSGSPSNSSSSSSDSGFSLSSILSAVTGVSKAVTTVEGAAELQAVNQQRIAQGLAPYTSISQLPGGSALSGNTLYIGLGLLVLVMLMDH